MQSRDRRDTSADSKATVSWGKFDKLAVTGTVVPSAKKVVREEGSVDAWPRRKRDAVQGKVFRGAKGELRTHGKR